MAAGLSRLSSAASRSLLRRFLSGSTPAFFGSAAQLDYYQSDFEEEEEDRFDWKNRPEIDAVGWVPPRGVQWVVIGDRAAKKNLYAQRLSKLLQVPHISMGTLVRQELYPRSSLHNQIANALSEGKLVPEDIIFALLSKRLEDGYQKGETGFILDGIPRTRLQAEILDQMADVDLVVNLKNEELSQNKNLSKGNLNAAKLSLLAQDRPLTDSNDDLNVYANQSKALEDYYRKQRKIVDFDVSGQSGDTWQGLLAVLRLQHINALSSSSQKLTA